MRDAEERTKYEQIWELPEYRERSPGLRHLADALAVMRPLRGASFTDWGCGSGAAAISLAAHRGASTVILLGYDCQYTDGKRHWHGDHPRGLGNAGSVAKWVRGFEELASAMEKAGVRVLNASRETALTCWERVGLDDALADG